MWRPIAILVLRQKGACLLFVPTYTLASAHQLAPAWAIDTHAHILVALGPVPAKLCFYSYRRTFARLQQGHDDDFLPQRRRS